MIKRPHVECHLVPHCIVVTGLWFNITPVDYTDDGSQILLHLWKLRVLFSTFINDSEIILYNGASFVIHLFQRLFRRERSPPLWTCISPGFCCCNIACFLLSSASRVRLSHTALPLPGSTVTILFLLIFPTSSCIAHMIYVLCKRLYMND